MADPTRQFLFLIRDRHGSANGHYSIVRSTGYLKTQEEKFCFLSKKLQDGVVLGSCEGLVLVMDSVQRGNKRIYLWNPSVRKYTTIPCPDGSPLYLCRNRIYQTGYVYVYGLCYDSSTDDYKVVAITTNNYIVYSLKNRSWSEEKSFGNYDGISQSPSVFVNGFLHWVVTRPRHIMPLHSFRIGWYVALVRENSFIRYAHSITSNGYDSKSFQLQEDEYAHEILCFDPKTDTFEVNVVPRPDILKETNVFYLTSLRGCLGLHCFNNCMRKIAIWLWQEDCGNMHWTEFATIVIDAPVLTHSIPTFIRPLLVTEDMEIVFHFLEKEILIYDMKTGGYRTISCSIPNMSYANAVTCVDSLLLPGVSDKPQKMWLSSETKKINDQD